MIHCGFMHSFNVNNIVEAQSLIRLACNYYLTIVFSNLLMSAFETDDCLIKCFHLTILVLCFNCLLTVPYCFYALVAWILVNMGPLHYVFVEWHQLEVRLCSRRTRLFRSPTPHTAQRRRRLRAHRRPMRSDLRSNSPSTRISKWSATQL